MGVPHELMIDADGHVCEPADLWTRRRDARYPGVVAELREHTEDMAPDARAKLLGGNALRLYGLAGPGAAEPVDRARV